MANSYKSMIKDKTIKRTDTGMFIRLEDIHIKPGFNKRLDDERTRAGNDELFQFLAGGGTVPPIEVTPRDEGGVWVVEGHRRHGAYTRCKEAGKPVEWIAVVPFAGNDVDRVARIMTSNNQLALTQFEQAMVVKELAGFNLKADEIAKLINKTRQHVDSLLILANANHDVQQLVKAGTVAVDVAVDMVRKHGEGAGETLKVEVEKAASMGKAKVTKSLVKGPSLPRAVVEDMTGLVHRVVTGLSPETVEAVEQYRTGAIDNPDHPVTISVRDLLGLAACSDHINTLLVEAERKAKERADKARQAEEQGQ